MGIGGYVVNAAALWVRIQTSLKNYKWPTEAEEWPTHSCQLKYIKNIIGKRYFKRSNSSKTSFQYKE
jgi:hypothetical protein